MLALPGRASLPRLLSTAVAVTAVLATLTTPAVSIPLTAPAAASPVTAPAPLADLGDGSTLAGDGLEPAPGQLLAGAAEGLLRVPVGTPLGGYLRPPVGGEQFDSQTPDHVTDVQSGFADDGTPIVHLPDEARTAGSPFATISPPSRGFHDALVTKALALSDGTDTTVIVKVDAIGMLDELTLAVAQQVQDRTGADIADGLIMTATHTHHGPGAVAGDSVRYFWAAMDAFQPEVLDRMVADIADVVVDALDGMVPARFGYVMGREGGQHPDQLNSWRRSRDPWTAERVAEQEEFRRRLGVIRVDEVDPATGEAVRPLAVVMNYAAHGIMFDVENLFFSGGAMAGAERAVEGTYDTPVVSMFLQSASGDVSPRADADGRGRPKLQRIERFGVLLGTQVRALADGIDNWTSTPDIEVVSQRVALSREALGYAEGEYPHEFGAVQCNNADTAAIEAAAADRNCVPAPPPDPWDLADNGHAENASFVPLDTRITVAQIGSARLITQPGEPVTEYGLQLAEASSTALADTFVIGYAQDHIGYLLPDSREDWLLGGTEGTTTFWGWKLGGRLLEATADLMAALDGTAPAPADEVEVAYVRRPYVAATPTPAPRAGRVVTQPADVERFGSTTFRFEGGDPVADLPTVVLEVQGDDGAWAPALARGGRPVDAPFEYSLTYLPGSQAHTWVVGFEPAKDWPAGTYRFTATGRTGLLDGGYAVTSEPFAVTPADTLIAGPVTRDGDTVSVTVAYTPVPQNRRLVDAALPATVPAPVRTGQVTFGGAGGQVTDLEPDLVRVDANTIHAVFTAVLPGTDVPTATAVDAWGNMTPAG
jgi:neutral ceramidase